MKLDIKITIKSEIYNITVLQVTYQNYHERHNALSYSFKVKYISIS